MKDKQKHRVDLVPLPWQNVSTAVLFRIPNILSRMVAGSTSDDWLERGLFLLSDRWKAATKWKFLSVFSLSLFSVLCASESWFNSFAPRTKAVPKNSLPSSFKASQGQPSPSSIQEQPTNQPSLVVWLSPGLTSVVEVVVVKGANWRQIAKVSDVSK